MTKDGIKHDDGKLRWTLLPWGALREIVEVMEFGAREYGVANWQRLADPERRYLDALIRHVVAHASGERRDPKTGLRHLAHAATNAIFLLWFEQQKRDEVPHAAASARAIESIRSMTPEEYLAEAEANLCEPSHLPPGARPLDVALREAREEAAVLREALRRVCAVADAHLHFADVLNREEHADMRAACVMSGHWAKDFYDPALAAHLASLRAAALGESK